MAQRVAICIAASPLIVFASYPGVFVIAGLIAALAVANLRERSRPAGCCRSARRRVGAVSVLLLVIGPGTRPALATILADWRWAFPAGLDPISLPSGRAVRSWASPITVSGRSAAVLLMPIGVGLAAAVAASRARSPRSARLPDRSRDGRGHGGAVSVQRIAGDDLCASGAGAAVCRGLWRIVDRCAIDRRSFARSDRGPDRAAAGVLSARDMIGPDRRPQTAAAAAHRPGGTRRQASSSRPATGSRAITFAAWGRVSCGSTSSRCRRVINASGAWSTDPTPEEPPATAAAGRGRRCVRHREHG